MVKDGRESERRPRRAARRRPMLAPECKHSGHRISIAVSLENLLVYQTDSDIAASCDRLLLTSSHAEILRRARASYLHQIHCDYYGFLSQVSVSARNLDTRHRITDSLPVQVRFDPRRARRQTGLSQRLVYGRSEARKVSKAGRSVPIPEGHH